MYKYICNKCNFISQWNNHIKTELYKTCKKTIKYKKEVGKCNKYNYITNNHITMLKTYIK